MVFTPFNIQKWDVGGKEDATLRRSLTVQAKAGIAIGVIVFIVALTVILVCLILPFTTRDYWLPDYKSDSTLGKFESAAVSTDAAPCAVIGRDILEKGGSAVDAAIAVLLCMGVVNPQSCGLGGGFFMIYYNKTEGTAEFIDAREVAPSKAHEYMFEDVDAARIGGLAIAVPSELAGYYDIHNRFGQLDWEELFPPTIKLCRDGITVTHHLEKALKIYKKYIYKYENMRNVFVVNSTGELLKAGDVYKRLDLANTLEVIAKEKLSALYGPSELATRFLKDLKEAGSIIEEADLRRYTPRLLEPLRMTLEGNLTLYTAPLPGSGALLNFMLNVLKGYNPNPDNAKTKEDAVLFLHRIIETFKFAYAKRMFMEDNNSEEMKELIALLTSEEYAGKVRTLINDQQTFDSPEYYGVNVTVQEDHGTAHVSIVAPNGDAVSATSTVNQYFGSMVMSPSTGIILNDEMDDFSLPNITNYFGVAPTEKNHVVPGRRPLSSMTPTVIVDSSGDVRLVVGGNGGTQITTSVAQIILRNIYLKEDIKKSIDAPRFHHQLLPNQIEHEALFPEELLTALKEKGHKLHGLGEKMVGIVMGIAREEDGNLYANSDYRKEGAVDGF